MQLSVSYLSSKYSKEQTIKMLENTNINYLHVDLMDGGFVPTKNFTISEVLNLLKDHSKPLDIHLMTFDPIIYIKDLITLKPEYITFHIEATKDIVNTIKFIKNHNIKVGLTLKPTTDLLELMPYLPFIDLVLIMSVNPGQSWNWGRTQTAVPDETTGDYSTVYVNTASNGTNMQLSTSIPLFTGLELPNQYALAKLNLKAATADLEKAKEDISINIASAYLFSSTRNFMR